MKNLSKDIEAFHEKFGLNYVGRPRLLNSELNNFRARFMVEEADEYHDCGLDGDLEGQLDAVIDLMYVTLGSAYMQGFTPDILQEAWDRVHAANMAKVRALNESDSKRGSTYDVVKPEGWTAPDLSDLIT